MFNPTLPLPDCSRDWKLVFSDNGNRSLPLCSSFLQPSALKLPAQTHGIRQRPCLLYSVLLTPSSRFDVYACRPGIRRSFSFPTPIRTPPNSPSVWRGISRPAAWRRGSTRNASMVALSGPRKLRTLSIRLMRFSLSSRVVRTLRRFAELSNCAPCARASAYFPLLAQTGADVPIQLEAKQYLNFTGTTGYQQQLERLVESIDARAGIVMKAEYRNTYVTAPPLPVNFIERPLETGGSAKYSNRRWRR